MMKQSFFLLCFTLLLALLPRELNAATWTAQDGLTYTIFITGTGDNAVADSAWVVRCQDGFTGAANIASSITYPYTYTKIIGYNEQGRPIYETITRYLSCPVTSMTYYAFEGTDISSISIPNSVRIVGRDSNTGCELSFKNCKKLTSVSIPSSVTNLSFAFEYCRKLSSVSIPNSVTDLPYTFIGCTSLSSVNIPSSVTQLTASFIGCTSLTSVNLPNSLITIGTESFWDCSSLNHIDIPNSVTFIGQEAFVGCTGLKRVEIPASLNCIAKYAFKGLNIEELVWNSIECKRETNYIPDLSLIPFPYDCIIDHIIVGPEVKRIGSLIFYYGEDWGNATRMTWNPIHYDDEWITWTTYGLEEVIIGDRVEVLPTDFVSGSNIKEVTIPNSVDTIFYRAFAGCKELQKVYWNAVNCHTTDMIFAGCDALTDIIIGENVESIGGPVFGQADECVEIYDNIEKVSCHAVVPPTISRACFTDKTYENAMLCVPEGSLEAYRNAVGWKEFFKFTTIEDIPGEEEKLRGDVDGDGVVNISDVSSLINYLLTGDATGIDLDNADCYQDDNVNIQDVVALINYLLTGRW